MTPTEEMPKWMDYCAAQGYKYRESFPAYDQDDVTQIAMIACWKAMEAFDPERCHERARTTFICRRIRQGITTEFNRPRSGGAVKANRSTKRIKDVLDTYQPHIHGDVARIATELGMHQSTVLEIMVARKHGRNRTASVVATPNGDEDTMDALESCPSNVPSPDTHASSKEEWESFLGTANSTRERYILFRVGLGDSYAELATQLGVSYQRIGQIVRRCKTAHLDATLTCPTCNAEFAQHTTWQVHCSPACRKKSEVAPVCAAPGCATIVTSRDRSVRYPGARRFCSMACVRKVTWRPRSETSLSPPV